MKVLKDEIKVEIKLHGQSYSFGSTQYSIDSQGQVLVGSVIVTDEDKKKLVEMSMRTALEHLSDNIAKDLCKFMEQTYAKEIKQEIKKFVKENKKQLMGVVMREVAKDAEAKLEELYTDRRMGY